MAQPWDLLHSWTTDRIASLNPIIATSDGQSLNGTPAGDWMRSDEHDDVTLDGSDGDDAITADGGIGGVFSAGAGNDYLSAGRVGEGFEEYPQNSGGVFNGGSGDDLFDGNEGFNVTFNGGDGNDVLIPALATESTFNGDAGDDFLFLEGPGYVSSSNTYNGGAGTDTAIFDDRFDSYDFKRIGQVLTITKGNSTATVTGIEYFRFTDPETGQYRELTFDQLTIDRSATVGAAGDDYVDGLLQGSKWQSPATYTFPGGWYAEGDGTDGDRPGHMLAMRSSYNYVQGITLLNLNEVTRPDEEGYPLPGRNVDIPIELINGATTVAAPNEGGHVHLYEHAPILSQLSRAGNAAYLWDLQVTARSLGLKFASAAGGVADVAVPADKDSLEYTVLSQRSYPGGPAGAYTAAANDFPQGFMALDIQALQALYGADHGYNSGDTVYRWYPGKGDTFGNSVPRDVVSGTTIFRTIWDGGGNDTYDFSNYTEAMSIDLSPGGYSLFSQAQRASLGDGVHARGNIYNAYLHDDNPASLIENAIAGSGNDTLRGNIANNRLNGGAGADTMTGLAGDDTYIVDNAGDVVVEAAGEGADFVLARVSYVLPANVENGRVVETSGLEMRGNGLANIISGNTGGNALYGLAGDDQLYGFSGKDHLDGGTGADQMIGGRGDDTYIVDSLADVVFEKPGEGTDTLWTSVSRGLDSDFENIVLFGTATDAGGNGKGNIVAGNALNNNLYGGGGSDSLYGHDGSDRLFGEDGNDYMTGGRGTDAYYGGAGYDYAIIEEGGGVDYFVDWNVTRDRVVFDSAIFSSIGAATSAAFQNGTDVVIWDGSDGIVLQNAKLANLTTSNFLLV